MRCGTILCAGLFAAALSPVARADVPRTIPFQAQVKTAADKPVTSPSVFTFSFYSAATGGTALWSESQTLTPSGGLISTVLGNITPLTVSFDQPLFVGVSMGSAPR